jgi:hypothetical protein
MVRTSFARKKRKIYRFLFNFNKLIFININFTKLFCLILTDLLFYINFYQKNLIFLYFFSQLTITFSFKELFISDKFRFFYINIQNFLLNVNRLILIFLDFCYINFTFETCISKLTYL